MLSSLLLSTRDLVNRILFLNSLVISMILSLLPLSALLLALPALVPEETVLTTTNRRSNDPIWAILKRLIALVLGLIALEAMVIFSIEAVGRLVEWGALPSRPDLASFLWTILPADFIAGLPIALRKYPTYVLLMIYLLDLLILLAIGKVPLNYNIRNLLIRWRITLLTSLAFTVVVALLIVMLAFVNGMYELTQSTGQPGNIIALSEGSTDEIFSDLGYRDLAKIGLERCTLDEKGRPLPSPVTFATLEVNGQTVPMYSRETFFTLNQPVPVKDGSRPKRRFVQMRGIYDPALAAAVHGIELKEGGRWWISSGADANGVIQGVLGESIAAEFGRDIGKPTLEVGDLFTLGDKQWQLVGIMKSEGTTFGSEVWGKQELLCSFFGKLGPPPERPIVTTTMVLRVADNTQASAKAMAYHLSTRYQEQKLRAVTEIEYYDKLSETNKQFLVAIMVVAAVMAVGGIFGVMNTMFAAIASRIKDIGVMRIIGFKRWQILVSFMLESLGIALAGGIIGCALGYLCNGYSATSIISSGQGGGKSIVLRLVVGVDLLLLGILFTLVMGRLGGLVPALTAMRLKILESLR